MILTYFCLLCRRTRAKKRGITVINDGELGQSDKNELEGGLRIADG